MYWKEYNSLGIWRYIVKGGIILLLILILVFSFQYLFFQEVPEVPDEEEIPSLLISKDPPTPPGSNRLIDKGRHVLTIEDESPHRFSRREWWYFNVFFNDKQSDLHNWSMIISFNKMAPNDIRYLKQDNFFLVLYDPEGTCYNFGSLDNPRGVFKAEKPGVDLTFEDSWAKGKYPQWQIHAESINQELVVDLDFTADFMPVWVEGRSSNLLVGGYVAGDYYIPRCNVTGQITWEKKYYSVKGLGYHDHVWETNIPRFITKGWQWFNIHFENGWEMYVSKFNLRRFRDIYLGAIVLSPNNRNLVEFNKFELKKIEEKSSTELPQMKYPVIYQLHAERDNLILDLDLQVYNICEIVWPKARTGMFEGPCRVTGLFSWDQEEVKLHGFGMSEVTVVQYFFQRLRILDRFKEVSKLN